MINVPFNYVLFKTTVEFLFFLFLVLRISCFCANFTNLRSLIVSADIVTSAAATAVARGGACVVLKMTFGFGSAGDSKMCEGGGDVTGA